MRQAAGQAPFPLAVSTATIDPEDCVPVKMVNLGILAHVDAGKTSLTERLLHNAGVIDEIGSVDEGSTQTDSMSLERQRGITIKAAVVSFEIGGVSINLIDTPGHPDFIAEVERVLSVLDGVILVISAVEGVQAQTTVLMRTLRRLRIPTVFFVNKIDRRGARYGSLLQEIKERLGAAVVAMSSVHDAGTPAAAATAFGPDDGDFTTAVTELVAEHDDGVLAAFVSDEQIPYERLRCELAALTQRAKAHPVFFGSAITGAGIDELTEAIPQFLPTPGGDAEGPLSASAFKVERGQSGEKIAYVRVFSGTIHARERLHFGNGREGKVTAINVFTRGSDEQRSEVVAGEIGKLWGLGDIQIGDTIGSAPGFVHARYFTPPTLETVVTARDPAKRRALHVALSQLAEQDPLINLRQDEIHQEVSVSLYGEVQKEVIEVTLSEEFGVEVEFSKSTTICVERPTGIGSAFELIGTDSNPFLATVGLRIEPSPIDSGIQFRLGVELGSMPSAFFNAVQETIPQTLKQGLHGWQVLDCIVTMTHSGYWARQSHAHGTFDKSMSSTAGDFRNLTPLVLMDALRRAGTTVYEPVHLFRLEAPSDIVGQLYPVLARLNAVPRTPVAQDGTTSIEGEIPAARVYELQQLLPGLTRGEGVLESAFDHYQPVTGAIPERLRTDHNPLDREEYLTYVKR